MSADSISLDNPTALAHLHVYSELGVNAGLVGQMAQRAALVRAWRVPPGASVLEIGCGQGDMSIVLAAAAGPTGHVTALDPGALDYGSPRTLGQAHDFIRAGPLASRITFHQADAPTFATARAADAPTYDIAMLALCSWYFATPAALRETLALAGRLARRVCVAEWALCASVPAAAPHVLAVLAQAAFECRNPASTSNVRTLLGPAPLTALATEAGLRLANEQTVVPPDTMYDGRWEVAVVRDVVFVKKAEEVVENERERAVVLALRDATLAAVAHLGEQKVASMDVWVADFESASTL